MNQHEAKLFNELLEVNWEMGHGNHNPTVKMALVNRYHEIVSQLEDSMGRAEWRSFINAGKKMFAPKGGYGDESPEEVERMMESVR